VDVVFPYDQYDQSGQAFATVANKAALFSYSTQVIINYS
jgi:hypothetical protein